jgi:hypothetical protein
LFPVGKVVPEEAVLEMKFNYSLPVESDEHVDQVVWIELSREKCEEMVQTLVSRLSLLFLVQDVQKRFSA